jgi:lysozyme family protein
MGERFEKFIEVVLAHEGGYVNDPDDFGGETNMGITKRRYPNLDIKNLTISQAKQIYYEDFYLPLNLHYIKNDLLALHVFDMAVNAGKKNAVTLLQELLFGCDNDGAIGPVTGQAVYYADSTTDLVEAYRAKRIEYYYKVSKRRNNKKFLAGWINRVYKTVL